MLSIEHIALFLAVTLPTLAAQEQASQDELRQRYEQKIASPFAQKIDWMFELAAARKASEDGKRIFAYFSRSYTP